MGRILRKKQSGTKKKQKAEKLAVAGPQEVAADREANLASAGEAVVKREKKKTVVPLKKQPAAASPVAAKPRDDIFSKSAQFLREVKVELKKVTWPSRKQTVGSTVVVIALVMVISLFLGVVDLGISSLIRIVLQ